MGFMNELITGGPHNVIISIAKQNIAVPIQGFSTYSCMFSSQIRSLGLQVWNSIPGFAAQVSMLGSTITFTG